MKAIVSIATALLCVVLLQACKSPTASPVVAATPADTALQSAPNTIYSPAIDPQLKEALVRVKLGQGKMKTAAARAIIEQKAAEGDSWAIRYLADTYFSGSKSYPQSTTKAVKHYEMLAECGDRYALLRLVGIFSDGKTAVKDPPRVLQYLKMAAGLGDNASAMKAAEILERGDGVAKDPVAAKEWYVRAALLGNKPARDWIAKHQ